MAVAFQCENDRHASQVLEEHWPGLNRGDVHGTTIERDTVDVLCGGFPCQDYSVAGDRSGLAGDRGAMWWEFHRLIDEGRPTWVVGENVPGLLSSRDGRDFETIVSSLAELGYGVVWAVLDAQYFGVAQRRRRVFIVGHSGGQPRPEILALSEGLFGHPEPSRGEEPYAKALTRSGIAGNGGVDWASAQSDHVVPIKAFAENTRNEVRESDVIPSLSTGGGKPGQSYPAIHNGQWVRRLTPLECERLQGFPDNWTASQTDRQRYRQMGNAVAVPVAEWILRRIADAD